MVSFSLLNGIAASVTKPGNDTHQLVPGARAGIGEPDVAAGELSNSIMPGKTKLRQCAALTMVATRVAVITSA